MVSAERKDVGSVGCPDPVGNLTFLPLNQWRDSLQFGEGQEQVHAFLVS